MNSKQRAALRSIGNSVESTFQIGKSEISPIQVQALDAQLEKRELVKVSVLRTSPVPAKEAAEILTKKLKAETVAVTGSKILLYRRSKNDQVQHIEF